MQKLISRFLIVFLLVSCSKKEIKEKILIVTSNQHTYGNTKINASNHFAEIVLAYDEFINAGYDVDFVSPKGGKIWVGYIDNTNATQKRYLDDEAFMSRLTTTMSPNEVNTSEYIAVYYGGGGAAMFGVPENKGIQDISMAVYEENNGVISAICHGSASLAYLKTKDGKYLVEGKKVNGFPDAFELMDAEYYATFPFSIQQKLIANGGLFEYSKEGWDDFSIADGRLITGQDPTAARSVARKVIAVIKQL